MPNMNLGKKARHTASITNRTSIFGIMGGTIQSGNYRNSIRSATYRATTLNKIPPKPTPGKEYMLAHNLLSRNPQCSGGVGRMHTHPGACGPCNCMSSDDGRDPRGGPDSNDVHIYNIQPTQFEGTGRGNIVDIAFDSDAKQYANYDITTGNDFVWPPTAVINDDCTSATITFKANRWDDKGVAKHWKNHLDNDSSACLSCAMGYTMVPNSDQRNYTGSPAQGSCQPWGGTGDPNALNFWFCGQITQFYDSTLTTTVTRNFCLAQGSGATDNNWFMAIQGNCTGTTTKSKDNTANCSPICHGVDDTNKLNFYLPEPAYDSTIQPLPRFWGTLQWRGKSGHPDPHYNYYLLGSTSTKELSTSSSSTCRGWQIPESGESKDLIWAPSNGEKRLVVSYSSAAQAGGCAKPPPGGTAKPFLFDAPMVCSTCASTDPDNVLCKWKHHANDDGTILLVLEQQSSILNESRRLAVDSDGKVILTYKSGDSTAWADANWWYTPPI